MNITFEQFKSIVTLLKTELIARHEYLDQIPEDIQTSFFDNFYSNSQGRVADQLADMLFAENAEDVAWFLYECDYDKISRIGTQKGEYVITSIEAYFDYARQEMNFKK